MYTIHFTIIDTRFDVTHPHTPSLTNSYSIPLILYIRITSVYLLLFLISVI